MVSGNTFNTGSWPGSTGTYLSFRGNVRVVVPPKVSMSSARRVFAPIYRELAIALSIASRITFLKTTAMSFSSSWSWVPVLNTCVFIRVGHCTIFNLKGQPWLYVHRPAHAACQEVAYAMGVGGDRLLVRAGILEGGDKNGQVLVEARSGST